MTAIVFWILLFLIVYSYFGYTVVLLAVYVLKRKEANSEKFEQPHVTLFIAAYNEKEVVNKKLQNSFELNYPKEKLHFLWITDGSTDGTAEILQLNSDVTVLHETARSGKIGAINRGMAYVTTPIVVFCDANTILNPEAINEVVKCFSKKEVGCVAGEKRIVKNASDKAVGSGEGFYWKYESFIKKLESEINSTIGAAGELFAIRTELFEPVESDTILDDFVISLRIAEKGYKVKYAPNATATETSSANIEEELKRKIRIAAGGIQTMVRLSELLNIFRFGMLSFQYWSHKVLRWTIVPIAMILVLVLNFFLVFYSANFIYSGLLFLQCAFYLLAMLGYLMRNRKIRLGFIFAPYYLVTMNYAIIMGIVRHLKGKQSVNWEKAKRV